MTKIGRNSPCPCGSGRKYKKCCLGTHGRSAGFAQLEWRSALEKLERFAEAREWEEDHEEAFDELWGACSVPEDEELGVVFDDVYDYFLFFDWPCLSGDGLVVDSFLQSGPACSTGELNFLAQARESTLQLYEVTEVQPGAGLTLREVLGGKEVRVHERTASRTLHRWDLLAARVFPFGLSGQAELFGSVLPFPRARRERLVSKLRRWRDEFAELEPDATAHDFAKTLAPFFLQAWVQPLPPPVLQTTDGEELRFLRLRFEVRNRDGVVRALDGAEQLARDEGEESWSWGGVNARGQEISRGRIELGNELVLEVLSEERAAKGRELIELLAPDRVRFVAREEKDVQELLKQAQANPRGATPAPGPTESCEVAEALSRHYHAWLDEEIPALEGKTPRQAARTRVQRPRLVELLKDLERQYERGLVSGQAAYDPTWMWEELGLSEEPDAPASSEYPPLLGHESLERHVPGIGEAARQIAARLRGRVKERIADTLSHEELGDDEEFLAYCRGQGELERDGGASVAAAAEQATIVAAHLEYLVNFELHLRKTFWIDASLAWMLGETNLDVTADLLRLPFGSFALVLSDRWSLGLAERALAEDSDCPLAGRMLRVLTVYVTEDTREVGWGLRLAFVFDALAGQWPYLLARELTLDPEADLNASLDSHFSGAEVERLDPILRSYQLKRLVLLVLNAVLYATSSGVESQLLTAPVRSEGRIEEPPYVPSSEEVYFLPGKIEISRLRELRAVERAPGGRRILHRFVVRGHWRRANPSWKDPRPRWIKPYWKGPSMATVIERAYRLKP